MKLGTLDWGIGGLDLHERLRRDSLAPDALYLSDAGHTPYGKLPETDLATRVASMLTLLARAGCTHVALGCNAASSVLAHPEVRRAAADLDAITGVVQPAVDATLALRVARVTVLGGDRTVASRVYAAPLSAAGVQVRQRVAQPLSALIEAGVVEGPELDACLDAILAPIRDAAVVILACTHYPAVESAIRAHLPRLERVIDPARETARHLENAWGSRAKESAHEEPTSSRYWTTGDPSASERGARIAFGIEAPFTRVGG